MKLRLRSLESKETVKIEVPGPGTLDHLKDTLLRALSSSFSADSLRFSLNRKDELRGSSPEDSLQSMGIASGDLVFYTFNPSGFSSQGVAPIQSSQAPVSGASSQGSSSSSQRFQFEGKQTRGVDCDLKKPRLENFDAVERPPLSMGPQSVGADITTRSMVDEGETNLDSDCEEMDAEDEPIEVVENKCSRPIFLRRVLKEELGYDRNAHKLLVTAVHAVLLESGFVLIDPNLGAEDHSFHMPEDWPSPSFTMSLWYTLPELLAKGGKRSTMTEIVLLKFQSLGHFVNVYGSLGCSRGSSVYRVSLDERKFAPNLDLIWADSASSFIMDENEWNRERHVFEFWKVVKDALALPLLIDLCEKNCLPPPASFMLLPGDVKLKILEALPGVDIARVECVCTELHYLANELWKLKCKQEFGLEDDVQGHRLWKQKYVGCLEGRRVGSRRTARWRDLLLRQPRRPAAALRRQPRIPYPFAVPHVIGGDQDSFPGIRLPPVGLSQLTRVPRRRQGFIPNCDFGGR